MQIGTTSTEKTWRILKKTKNRTTISSVAQSCSTLCNPTDCSMPGFPVHHQLPELAQIHVHRVSDAIQPSYPLSSPFSSCLQPSPASESFLSSQLFTSGGQSITASASALILPMLDLLAVQGTQESSPTPQLKSINSTALSFLFGPTLTSIHDYWKFSNLTPGHIFRENHTSKRYPNVHCSTSYNRQVLEAT